MVHDATVGDHTIFIAFPDGVVVTLSGFADEIVDEVRRVKHVQVNVFRHWLDGGFTKVAAEPVLGSVIKQRLTLHGGRTVYVSLAPNSPLKTAATTVKEERAMLDNWIATSILMRPAS